MYFFERILGYSYGDVGFTNDSFKGSYAAQFDGDADHYKVTDIYANGTGRDTGSFSLWFYNSSGSISGHKYIFRYVLNGGNDILLGFESGGSAYLQIHGCRAYCQPLCLTGKSWPLVVLMSDTPHRGLFS